jgi:alpha-beta hydrolase superfamily lysophospholipase
MSPADLGLPFETLSVRSGDEDLPAWFIPAGSGEPGPGVVLVHGWESARDRTLPLALFLHAAGFHCLTIDIRGHGANPPETMPLTAGEFGDDALAAFQALIARPDVTSGAIVGHSMGAIGALLAGAADPRVAAVVATSTPADPYRLTRQTFRLARLPIPDPIAYPLAWLTTHVYLRPRRHVVEDISATAAVLLIHGDDDDVVPVGHLSRLAAAARRARVGDLDPAPVETLVIAGGQHSWLYEDARYRAEVARFLAAHLEGSLAPLHAASLAAATPAERVPAAEERLSAVDTLPGGFRTLVKVALPGATKRVEIETLTTADEPGLG